MGSGESRTDDDTLGVTGAWLDTKITRPTRGGRRKWLGTAGVALTFVLAAAALGLTLVQGCECECCAPAVDDEPSTTTAEVAALNLTLAAASAQITALDLALAVTAAEMAALNLTLAAATTEVAALKHTLAAATVSGGANWLYRGRGGEPV